METIDSIAQHAALIAGLRAAAAFAHPTGEVEVIETHISTVILAGGFAYKIKKPVNLGFADFSSLALRKHFCEEEIRLNRRAAPDLYLGVAKICGTLEHPRVGDDGGASILEYAVRMRRFAGQARLDQVAQSGRLTPDHIDRLAATIAAFHAGCDRAPPDRGYGSIEEIRRWATENAADLRAEAVAGTASEQIERLQAWTALELARHSTEFTARQIDGHVRECHGDLHLGNLVLLGDTPVPFDCIEFNDRLRFIDVINDVAFTFMDLIEHERAALAWRFIGAYLEHTGDYPALAVLRFYAVYRALVRAKVARIRLHQPGTPADEKVEDLAAAARYVDVAQRLAAKAAPRLILTCGLAGSGKTTVAQNLLERIGAVRVRSDVERKRLFGVDPASHRVSTVGAGLYAADATRRTCQRLLDAARAILKADIPAIVDATFLKEVDRRMFRELAQQAGAQLSIVACQAPLPTLRARIDRRLQAGSDPSDATLEVLEHQLEAFEALTPDEQAVAIMIDTDTDLESLERRCEQAASALRGAARAGRNP
jgi:uncharacterized protein